MLDIASNKSVQAAEARHAAIKEEIKAASEHIEKLEKEIPRLSKLAYDTEVLELAGEASESEVKAIQDQQTKIKKELDEVRSRHEKRKIAEKRIFRQVQDIRQKAIKELSLEHRHEIAKELPDVYKRSVELNNSILDLMESPAAAVLRDHQKKMFLEVLTKNAVIIETFGR